MKEFITNVQLMRMYQRSYFANIATAKKTKLPGDFAKAANSLKESKRLEALVDAAAPEVLQQVQTSEAAAG